MAQELLYTSAPRGLKPGSRGFCTVLSTQGMPAPLASAVEALSGYRAIYPPSDERAARNPVVYSHLKMQATGRTWSVLSRIADYGLDYSQRPNKLAHHVILDNPTEQLPGGPANLLSTPGFARDSWEGDPTLVARKPVTREQRPHVGICEHWKAITGDAGWAGVVAESFLSDPDRQVILLFEPGQDILPLFAEAISLLPEEKRWDVTFSTYFTGLATGTTCNWRAMVRDSKEALDSLRAVAALRIDLSQPCAPTSSESYLISTARNGDTPETTTEPTDSQQSLRSTTSTVSHTLPAEQIVPNHGLPSQPHPIQHFQNRIKQAQSPPPRKSKPHLHDTSTRSIDASSYRYNWLLPTIAGLGLIFLLFVAFRVVVYRNHSKPALTAIDDSDKQAASVISVAQKPGVERGETKNEAEEQDTTHPDELIANATGNSSEVTSAASSATERADDTHLSEPAPTSATNKVAISTTASHVFTFKSLSDPFQKIEGDSLHEIELNGPNKPFPNRDLEQLEKFTPSELEYRLNAIGKPLPSFTLLAPRWLKWQQGPQKDKPTKPYSVLQFSEPHPTIRDLTQTFASIQTRVLNDPPRIRYILRRFSQDHLTKVSAYLQWCALAVTFSGAPHNEPSLMCFSRPFNVQDSDKLFTHEKTSLAWKIGLPISALKAPTLRFDLLAVRANGRTYVLRDLSLEPSNATLRVLTDLKNDIGSKLTLSINSNPQIKIDFDPESDALLVNLSILRLFGDSGIVEEASKLLKERKMACLAKCESRFKSEEKEFIAALTAVIKDCDSSADKFIELISSLDAPNAPRPKSEDARLFLQELKTQVTELHRSFIELSLIRERSKEINIVAAQVSYDLFDVGDISVLPISRDLVRFGFENLTTDAKLEGDK